MGKKPKFVVTLPAKANPLEFAREASDSGADLLELRDDLVSTELPIAEISSVIDVLVSRRTDDYLPEEWITAATLIDQDISLSPQDFNLPVENLIMSFHSSSRMKKIEIIDLWGSHCRDRQAIKYIEPYYNDSEQHLMIVRRLLSEISDCVTVLPIGGGSTNIRRILATSNYLHYCTLYSDSYSAAGQALLSDEIKFFKTK